MIWTCLFSKFTHPYRENTMDSENVFLFLPTICIVCTWFTMGVNPNRIRLVIEKLVAPTIVRIDAIETVFE